MIIGSFVMLQLLVYNGDLSILLLVARILIASLEV